MDQAYTNILVPVDGSKQAELALEKAVVSANWFTKCGWHPCNGI